MTICWHLDDLIIGHVEFSVVTNFLTWLTSWYDTANKKLNVTRGPHHDYLGMTIDFSEPGSVKFSKIPYISKILTGFPEKITGVSFTPAADHLFDVCPPHEASFLPEEQARSFHHTTAHYFFFRVFAAIFNQQLHFSPHLSNNLTKTIGANWRKLSNISIPRANCTSHFLPTLSPLSTGTLIHPIKHMMIAKDIRDPFLHLARVQQQARKPSTKYHPRAPPRVKSLVFMIRQATFCGCGIFSKHRITLSPITFFFRTIWAHFPWLRTAMFWAPNKLSTSRQNISWFATIITHKSSISNTAQRNSCGQTYLPSRSRVPNFVSCELSSWTVWLIIARSLHSFHLLILH